MKASKKERESWEKVTRNRDDMIDLIINVVLCGVLGRTKCFGSFDGSKSIAIIGHRRKV